VKYSFLRYKRYVESLFIYPFILVGRFISLLKPLKKEYKVFFFFPFYHTGGAEKVHARIVKATGSKDCIIYFTRRSADKRFLQDFIDSGCDIKDISKFTDNKWIFPLNLIYRGIISGWINRQARRPIVFNGQSNFGYKISPWINKKSVQVELIHALNTFSLIRIPYLEFYKKNITVSQDIINKHEQLYTGYKIPGNLVKNFIWIRSKIELPHKKITKDYHSKPLRLLFVGRDSIEKRPAIIAEIAKNIQRSGIDAEFGFAGDVSKSVPGDLRQYCKFYGDINEDELNSLYEKTHILLIPSTTESGPLVLMEAMAYGAAIISTNVGFVQLYVKDGVSGYIVKEIAPDSGVIGQMTEKIRLLNNDRNLLKEMGEKNLVIARENFDISGFNKEYQQLFEGLIKNETS